VGLWTIGIGHLLGVEKRMTSITDAEANSLLEGDIDRAIDVAATYVPELLYWASDCDEFLAHNNSRARALVNMAFNLGGRLGGFPKFLESIRKHEWTSAAKEMLNSKWATQVGTRATRLRDMILTED